MEVSVTDRNFPAENQDIVNLGARGAIPAGNGKLFENAGVVVDDPPVGTSSIPFGQNVHSKSFFEDAISTEWRKNVTPIIQTGALGGTVAPETALDVIQHTDVCAVDGCLFANCLPQTFHHIES